VHLYTFVRARRAGAEGAAAAGVAAGAAAGGEAGSGGGGGSGGEAGGPSLLEMGMAPGDMVLLSLDGLHAAIGRVTVHAIGRDAVTVASKKAVLVERYERQWRALGRGGPAASGSATQQQQQQQQQQWAGGGGATQAGGTQAGTQAGAAAGDAAPPWRLDKDEIASMSATLRTNLLRLAMDTGPRAARLRALLIDLAPPRLHGLEGAAGGSQNRSGGGENGSGGGGTPGGGAGLRLRLRLEAAEAHLREAGAGLNEEQAAAVRRVAGAEDYALVLGMPGAGRWGGE
jgi:hypothetical protein